MFLAESEKKRDRCENVDMGCALKSTSYPQYRRGEKGPRQCKSYTDNAVRDLTTKAHRLLSGGDYSTGDNMVAILSSLSFPSHVEHLLYHFAKRMAAGTKQIDCEGDGKSTTFQILLQLLCHLTNYQPPFLFLFFSSCFTPVTTLPGTAFIRGCEGWTNTGNLRVC